MSEASEFLLKARKCAQEIENVKRKYANLIDTGNYTPSEFNLDDIAEAMYKLAYKVEDPDERYIIIEKFIKGRPVSEVSKEMHLSRATYYRTVNRAIETWEKLYIKPDLNIYRTHPTEEVYSAMIPLEPRVKKNSQKIITNPKTRKPMIVQNEIYCQYERDAGWFLREPKQPIDYPVNVRCIFYRQTARRVDLTNLLEAIDDILVKYGVLKDDNFQIIAGHDGSRVYIDREKPRTEIYIEPISEYN